MRVGSTGPVIYLTGQSLKFTGHTCLDMYLCRVVGPWCLVLFPGCRALCFFTGIVCRTIMWSACEKRERDRNPRMGDYPRP